MGKYKIFRKVVFAVGVYSVGAWIYDRTYHAI